ncbi:AAA family ATPase [Bdellovibrionota bacterium FG-2]
MPNERKRHIIDLLESQRRFWPVIGVLGLRQVGKSTFLRNQAHVTNYHTFDDDDVRRDALASPKAFLAKLEYPVAIDEAQKVEEIFDAVKSKVDRKRIPGQFFLTGSSNFNTLEGIRESLTGRIGTCYLWPITLAELHAKPFEPQRVHSTLHSPLHALTPRFSVEDVSAQMTKGGIPVPAFVRTLERHKQYFDSWMDTTLGRDLRRAYGKGYDADIAQDLLSQMGRILAQGELPTSPLFTQQSRTLKKYFEAMQTIFLIRRMGSHELGRGHDVFLPTDSGVANFLMKYVNAPGATLSLTRIFVLNEILTNSHYAQENVTPVYFKSRSGSPVDLVWNGVPVLILSSSKVTGWDLRPLQGAMKTLKAEQGIVVSPRDLVDIPKKGGICHVPWGYWS